MEERAKKEAELKALYSELTHVEGTQTEVYSRIVGYYRSVRNWNAGKREEFSKRMVYSFPTDKINHKENTSVTDNSSANTVLIDKNNVSQVNQKIESYIAFTRNNCPNCPAVKKYITSIDFPGMIIDVDTPEGLETAKRYEVMATPTVVLLDGNGNEVLRTHSKDHLESIFSLSEKEKVSVSA